MASTVRPGIITWVNALRTTMANDPGRQTLHDQVQTNGFLFLDEYLDNILAGPKHDPIIELVKTPGRRKDLPKKTRAATAASNKAKAIIALSLEDDDYDKENSAPASSEPINSFHKKLLETKAADDKVDKPKLVQTSSVNFKLPVTTQKPETVAPVKKVMVIDTTNVVDVTMDDEEAVDDDNEEMVVEKLVTPPRSERPPSLAERPTSPSSRDIVSSMLVQSEPAKDLSMIPEDDEGAERSRSSIVPRGSASKPLSLEPAFAIPEKQPPSRDNSGKHKPLKRPPNLDMMAIMDIEDMTTTFTASTSASTQTFHSIDLDSPAVAPQDSQLPPPVDDHEAQAVDEHKEVSLEVKSSKMELQITATPFRAATPETLAPPTSPKLPVTKPGVPHFPTIGAPSPFRKSMRVPREPSMTVNHPAPGQKQGLTRSSWLVKAREAKAMEVSSKRASTVAPVHIPHEATGSKRKSDTMTDPSDAGDIQEEVERKHKLSKISETSTVHEGLMVKKLNPEHTAQTTEADDGSEHMLNNLKKKVEGFSARAGKSMGKSLGGAAATALAEARALAEAKVAERNGVANSKPEPSKPAEVTVQTSLQAATKEPSPVFTAAPVGRLSGRRSEANRRLSVSDLVTKFDGKSTDTESERVFKPPPPEAKVFGASTSKLADTSTSTSPSNSPSRSRSPMLTVPSEQHQPSTNAPVFSRPPAPSDNPSLTQTFETFSKLRAPAPLSAQSTYVSTQTSALSESIFDHEPSAWMPETQDTQFSDPGASQFSQMKVVATQATDDYMDADESWHDDKLDAAWMPAIGLPGKDDSMTWSSNPTQSVRGDTGTIEHSEYADDAATSKSVPAYEEPEDQEEEVANEMDMEDEDDDYAHQVRLVPSAAQSQVSLVSSQDSQARAESQASNTTSQSGFLGTAARLMTSVLGGSKNRKPEPVKSLQLAAAAAKKQQEAEGKKVARLKEMEARRQQIIQKKADEEKLRDEKKAKEDSDRRKREREDLTEKRALKQSAKAEDEVAKKRKIAETEKRAEAAKATVPEIKKTTATTKIGKPTLTMQSNASQSNLLSKSLKQSTSTTVLNKSFKSTAAPGSSQTTGKAKGKGKAMDDDLVEQPALAVQAQMQARVKAQLADLRKSEQPTQPSESIELPDINSEYSDSEDEDRVRTFDPPNWAQSPELRAQLQSMSTLDPDDIFGAIKPLKMEELFKTRTSRFRARTSSANWAGVDELTAHEEREYARRMGYKK